MDITRACMVLHNLCISEELPELDLAAHQIAAQGSGDTNHRNSSILNRSGIARREELRINNI